MPVCRKLGQVRLGREALLGAFKTVVPDAQGSFGHCNLEI